MARKRTADEWVRAAFIVLASQGAEAVRVESLARTLGVTKGSFYWHFANRRAFLRAMLTHWEAKTTAAIITAVEAAGGTPSQRLERLVRSTALHPQAPATEQAVRAWGASEPAVRRALARVDHRREVYVRGLLVEHGVPPTVASARTRILALAMIGEFARVAHRGPRTPAPIWSALVDSMLAPSRRPVAGR
jgi:AcrR family transcriptional regulator